MVKGGSIPKNSWRGKGLNHMTIKKLIQKKKPADLSILEARMCLRPDNGAIK